MVQHTLKHTLKDEICFAGKGLHTGEECSIRLCPSASRSAQGAPAREPSEIVFYRTALRSGRSTPGVAIPAFWRFVLDTKNCVTLGRDGVTIRTVEHLLSALAISGVDACDIYVTGPEIPLLDGAALEFLDGIQGVGLESMPFGGREAFRLSHPVWVDEGERTLVALPAESFRVSCVISFPHTAIGSQTCSFALDEEIYRKEIAPARTFCLEEDIARLRACGLALGGDYASVLVYGKDGPVGTESKYDDECVRHKALDLIGDISLLGSPLAAHVIGYKFGHALSVALVRRIAEICTLPQQSGEQQSGKGGV